RSKKEKGRIKKGRRGGLHSRSTYSISGYAPSVRNFPMNLNKMNSPESKERGAEIEGRDATSRNHDDRRGGHQTGNVCQPSSRKDAFTRCWRIASLRRPTTGGNGDRPQYYHPSHRLRACPPPDARAPLQ